MQQLFIWKYRNRKQNRTKAVNIRAHEYQYKQTISICFIFTQKQTFPSTSHPHPHVRPLHFDIVSTLLIYNPALFNTIFLTYRDSLPGEMIYLVSHPCLLSAYD